MKTLAASALIALSGLFGAAAYASAAPAHETVVVAHLSGDAHGHNYEQPENNDVVTNQGPNKATGALHDTIGTALGTR
ncbi:hypothetical protein [Segniliparus rugosus]|uniref:Uncharacterized protein n=1 Tax=Segniliparus rugosus (strain ATCC BAA-974 / DSM 45345 / CCUG 50838 / CIP 108380 / JCM 13579 / CDC 945) TaxID=679197 RepID=E5XRX8_SEGRC|nr:hypothetical protein [Segniliparus rugosus]EFV12913.1 hypothetical protein HMPREF9336_02250 [Segniliparus rugosus ATCC BAA-974]